MNAKQMLCAAALIASFLAPTLSQAEGGVEVFATDFESGLPAEFSAPGAAIEGVQGWSGLGYGDYLFGGSFLRHSAAGTRSIDLQLGGLPDHDLISVSTLVALIDSWDGEYFEILVDGELVFSEWFDLASSRTSSYAPPAGALLSSEVGLGFTEGYWYDNDHAYDLSVDESCMNIPHTGENVTITWRVNDSLGGQWQGGADESWAIEGVVVSVHSFTGTRSVNWSSIKSVY